ncbi:MAG: winged helix-turn-helix domain-containing protein [Candidatus Hydrogenedentes bacterium]|nr:winged helix-turn-helix domain-containing protein [Candidatus Hydrogenedentota bacterium]
MRDIMAVTKALADESRVRCLLALKLGELCVCQITALLELAPSTVSKHMAILRQARLVEARKEGRWIYYRLTTADESTVAAKAVEWLEQCCYGSPWVYEDQARLKQVLSTPPEVLCQIQNRG